MQNKGNCGCDQGFVPVNGNWDFNMDGSCGCQQTNASGRNCRRNEGRCNACEAAYDCTRDQADCQCERCGDARRVACCEQNTYIRRDGCETEECACSERQNRTGCTGKADCQCENCARSRRSSDCDTCRGDNAYARSRSADCACGKENDHDAAYGRSRKNRRVGMVNVEMQEIDEIFESESALRAGTLFPELHKPMNGYCPCDENCGTCQQAAAFAAWELRLYLNTHPNDKEALALFRKLCREAGEENYATTFLTDECCTNGWSWPRNPWPWEYDCRCGD